MKNKTCMICKLGIEVDEQEYVGVKHYKKKTLFFQRVIIISNVLEID